MSYRRLHPLSSWAAALAAAAVCLVAPTAARAVTYGVSDAPGRFATCPTYDDPCSSPGGVAGFWKSATFAALRSGAHPVGNVRLPVKYDAVSTWNGASGCTLSNPFLHASEDQGRRPHPAGEAWYDFLYGVRAAYADGLRPLITIVGYGAGDAARSYIGTSASGDPGEPDPTTSSGYWDYYCGVKGILNGIAAHLPAAKWPHQWEAWNEPNGGCTYLNDECSPAICAQINEAATYADPVRGELTCSATGQGHSSCAVGSNAGGAAKAACLWIVADNTITQTSGHQGDTVAAGTFSWPSTGYLAPYVALLASQGYRPPIYSVHDYGDATASGWLGGSRTDQLRAFDTALAQVTDAAGGAARELWITESGVDLTDRDRRYGNFDSIPCAGGSSATLPNTLGACVNANGDAQARSAQGFFDLQRVGGGPPVTALYWYQLAGAPGGWDSGLLDAWGRARAAYCVWTGQPLRDCSGSPQSTS